MSENKNIIWTVEIITYFQNQLHWDIFSVNSSAFKDLSFIDVFQGKIDWKNNSSCSEDTIAGNEGIIWDIELIEKYEDRIDFSKLSNSVSVCWSEKIIDKYKDRLDFGDLVANKSLPWSLELFDKYWDQSYFTDYGFKSNDRLYTFEFVEKYAQLLNWSNISSNIYLPWIEKDLLNFWSSKVVWSSIAGNPIFFKNDKNFFQRNYDKWYFKDSICWGTFSHNEAFPWSKELIEIHKYKVNWESLCLNEGIIWSPELIDTFSNHIIWGGYSPGPVLDDFGEIISQHGGFFSDLGLIHNQSIPWSIDFILKYENKIDFNALNYNSHTWDKAFKPFINHQLVDLIFRII